MLRLQLQLQGACVWSCLQLIPCCRTAQHPGNEDAGYKMVSYITWSTLRPAQLGAKTPKTLANNLICSNEVREFPPIRTCRARKSGPGPAAIDG